MMKTWSKELKMKAWLFGMNITGLIMSLVMLVVEVVQLIERLQQKPTSSMTTITNGKITVAVDHWHMRMMLLEPEAPMWTIVVPLILAAMATVYVLAVVRKILRSPDVNGESLKNHFRSIDCLLHCGIGMLLGAIIFSVVPKFMPQQTDLGVATIVAVAIGMALFSALIAPKELEVGAKN